MEPKSLKLLEDLHDAAVFIRQVIRAGYEKVTANKTLDDYRSDRLLRQAIERNFEIIGEAVGRLAKADPNTVAKIGKYQQIISFRNVLIHGYDLIDEEQVWEVIQTSLPSLEADVATLLEETDSN